MNGKSIATSFSVAMPGERSRSERLGCLFDTHYLRLYRLARRLSSNIDDARDLVQETFLRAAQSCDSIPDGVNGEEAWLVRVLVNIQRDQWRKNAVRARHERFEAGNGSEASSSGPDSEASIVARTTVWQAVTRLPPRRRAIVIMHELEGLSIAAIASLLRIRAVTVRWHLAMGRHDLNRALRTRKGNIHDHERS